MALAASAAATPSVAPDRAVVQRALDNNDLVRATAEFNALVTRRLPATDKSGPDPVLDRLLVQLIAVNGSPSDVATLLERITADPAAPDRAHFRLLLATAREEAGAFALAEGIYREVSADARATPADRATAAIGRARLRMMANPADALAGLAAVQPPRALAWEVDLQRARAQALAGQEEAATASLQRAWNGAPAAAVDAAAAARTASDMLVAAGRRGDRDRLIAALSVDRLNRAPNNGGDTLAANLPVCGGAVGPDDVVAIQFTRRVPAGHPRFSLVWASRPAIAPAFLRVAALSEFEVPDGQATAVTLRCRLEASASYHIGSSVGSQIVSWNTGHGAYPLLDTGDENDGSSLAGALAERERRYGARSIMLLPILLRMTESRADGASDAQSRIRAAELTHRIADIIAANQAPADLVLLSGLLATARDVAAQNKPVTTGQTAFREALTAAAANDAVSIDMLYALVSGAAAITAAPTELRIGLLEQTLSVVRARASADDPRVTALQLQLLNVRREQNDAAAVAGVAKQFGFTPDLCG